MKYMKTNRGPQKIGSLLKNEARQKPPAYEWQDLALKIIAELAIPKFKRSAVFKVCKNYPKSFIEKCLNDTKELCHRGECWKYFFKLVDKKSNK